MWAAWVEGDHADEVWNDVKIHRFLNVSPVAHVVVSTTTMVGGEGRNI